MRILLMSSLEPHEDRRTFFKACLVFWMLGAIDGHGKNFSFTLYPGGRLRLAPLYDVLSAYPVCAKLFQADTIDCDSFLSSSLELGSVTGTPRTCGSMDPYPNRPSKRLTAIS